jgi:hypothetical protein
MITENIQCWLSAKVIMQQSMVTIHNSCSRHLCAHTRTHPPHPHTRTHPSHPHTRTHPPHPHTRTAVVICIRSDHCFLQGGSCSEANVMHVFNDHFISRQLYPQTYSHTYTFAVTLWSLTQKKVVGGMSPKKRLVHAPGACPEWRRAKEKGTDVHISLYTRLVTASRTLSDTNSVMLCL